MARVRVEKSARSSSERHITTFGKVTVMCKLPNGLKLRLQKMVPSQELVMGGGVRDIMKAQPVGAPVVIHGNAVPANGRPRSRIVGGYAMTEGVDAEFWSQWVKDNADHPAVKEGLIFAHAELESAVDQAKDGRKLVSNLEPLTPDTDRRIPKPSSKNLTKLATADDMEVA